MTGLCHLEKRWGLRKMEGEKDSPEQGRTGDPRFPKKRVTETTRDV